MAHIIRRSGTKAPQHAVPNFHECEPEIISALMELRGLKQPHVAGCGKRFLALWGRMIAKSCVLSRLKGTSSAKMESDKLQT